MTETACNVDIPASARLLAEVFPGAGLGREDYLRWLYADSPFGPVIAVEQTDAQGVAAHYAVVPIALTQDGKTVRGALSLNTAVHERARGGGVFTRLAQATYDRAAECGVEVVVGVANANSTPGFTRRLGFRLLGPLPATVHWPRPARGAVESAWMARPADLETLAPLLRAPGGGLSRAWEPASLAWRLGEPRHRYALHVRPGEAAAVSTATVRKGVRVAVLCAVLAPEPLGNGSFAALVNAACRRHRAPVALHIGINAALPRAGRPLPERFRESPLNLIHRDLVRPDAPSPEIARWEALDFDAF